MSIIFVSLILVILVWGWILDLDMHWNYWFLWNIYLFRNIFSTLFHLRFSNLISLSCIVLFYNLVSLFLENLSPFSLSLYFLLISELSLPTILVLNFDLYLSLIHALLAHVIPLSFACDHI